MELSSIRGKKGAEMTVGTIVIIVLAVIVLVVIVLGFTTGWGNLWDTISNIFRPGSNLDAIVTGCKFAATSGNTEAFCLDLRELKQQGEDPRMVTCLDPAVKVRLDENVLSCNYGTLKRVAAQKCYTLAEGESGDTLTSACSTIIHFGDLDRNCKFIINDQQAALKELYGKKDPNDSTKIEWATPCPNA